MKSTPAAAALLGAAIAFAAAQHWLVWADGSAALQTPFDDAYITYRYIERAAMGAGLTYNDDAAVFGVSSPLWALWLLLLRTVAAVFADTSPEALRTLLPTLAVAGNGVVWSVFAVALWRLLRAWWPAWPRLALAATVVVALDPGELAISVGGMESTLLLALLACALHPATQRRPLRFGALAAAAALTRPEAAWLLALPLVSTALALRRASLGQAASRAAPARDAASTAAALRHLLSVGRGALMLVGPWLVFAWLRYGDVVPQSVRAKAAPLYPLPAGRALGDALFETGLPRLGGRAALGWLQDHGVAGVVAVPALQGAMLVAVLVVAVVLIRRRVGAGASVDLANADNVGLGNAAASVVAAAALWQPSLLLFGWLLLYWLGNPLLMTWYGPPLRLLARLGLVSVALAAVEHDLGRARVSGPVGRRFYRAVALFLGVAAASWLVDSAGVAAVARRLPASAAHVAVQRDVMRNRIAAYAAAADWLNRHAAVDARVLASEIGRLGWGFRGTVLDGAGLVTPAAVAFLPVPAEQCVEPEKPALSRELIVALDPDYIVSMPVFLRRSLFANATLRARYAEVARFALPTPLWGDDAVVVLRRLP